MYVIPIIGIHRTATPPLTFSVVSQSPPSMGLTRLSDTCRTRANEDGNCQWSAIGTSLTDLLAADHPCHDRGPDEGPTSLASKIDPKEMRSRVQRSALKMSTGDASLQGFSNVLNLTTRYAHTSLGMVGPGKVATPIITLTTITSTPPQLTKYKHNNGNGDQPPSSTTPTANTSTCTAGHDVDSPTTHMSTTAFMHHHFYQ
ncbi:hypothetical protein SCLCIDRAFT_32510 [Scleroderma citrinum Foug A]|uniref:Uncharacterized protein n=1 Tax=Scleroderma citrinum Foug A TaxID=1036808 RepID=A0A0C2YSC3_9AGAM|nr:hypothetical protein SCLCIDRAFT_32510 [Scleroderma citrinum Foug A]